MLKIKPRIYHRLSLLVNNSKTFKKKEDFYAHKIRNPSDDFIPHDSFKKAAEQLNEEYSLGITEEEKELAIPLLEYRLRAMSQGDNKVTMGFKDDELTITIKSPISKREFEDLWKTLIRGGQKNFILGFGTDIDEFYRHYDKVKMRRLDSHKKRKGKKNRYQELQEKRGEISLTEKEQEEFLRLDEEYNKIEVFKYTPKLENIDEDLLILRLANFYKSLKLAEDEYHKIKLAYYIKQRDGVKINFTRADEFHALVARYITENELLDFSKTDKKSFKVTDYALYKLIGAKNFKERLREIKEIYFFT